MSKLVKFLKDVSANRTALLQARDGKSCEELFRGRLKTFFTDMTSSDDEKIIKFKKEIKKTVLTKNGNSVVDNTLYINTKNGMYEDFFIAQPYGSQNYPDFLIFTKFKVFAVEIKYSTKRATKPVWNSNLPKTDGIYFFGCYQLGQLTFFRGGDILSTKERESLLKIWDDLDKKKETWSKSFRNSIKTKDFDNAYGFEPYIRKAYQQSKNFNSSSIRDFFENPNKDSLERKVIEFITETDR